ncbi:lipopolysaccharide biosynthesis protein [Haliea sp.]
MTAGEHGRDVPDRRSWRDRLTPDWLFGDVARAGVLVGAVQGVGLLLVFLLQILLARLIADPSAYGLYVWGQNLLFLVGGVLAMGLPIVAGRHMAVQVQRGDRRAQGAVLRRALALIALASVLIFALGRLLLWQLPPTITVAPDIALLALLGAPLAATTLLYQGLSRARGHTVSAFLPYQVLRPLFTAVLALAAVVVAGPRLSAIEALLAVVSGLALVHGVQWRLGRRPPRAPVAPSTADEVAVPGLSRLLREGLPVFGASACGLVMTYANTLAVGVLAGPAAAGAFFIAERLAQLASTPAVVASAVIQPWLATAHASHNRGRLQAVVTQAAHIGLWPTLVLAAGVWLCSEFLLHLFGAAFLHAQPILGALLLGRLIGVALGPAQILLLMTGHQGPALRVSAFAALSHLLLLVWLVPIWGAVGAALTSVASSLLINTGCLVLVWRRLGLQGTILATRRRG